MKIIFTHRRSQDFWLGGGQTTNPMKWRHQKFSKENFLWDKDIVDWKIRNRGLCLAYNQDFATGKELNPKVKSEIGKRREQTSVSETYHKRGYGGGAPSL